MGLRATCHCGACAIGLARVPADLTRCNCSICRRYGVLWAYHAPEEVDLSGLGPTETYLWDDRSLAFHRCAACGCVTHWEPLNRDPGRMGVNANLLPPEVVAPIRVRRLDGAGTERYVDD